MEEKIIQTEIGKIIIVPSGKVATNKEKDKFYRVLAELSLKCYKKWHQDFLLTNISK